MTPQELKQRVRSLLNEYQASQGTVKASREAIDVLNQTIVEIEEAIQDFYSSPE